MFGIKFVKNTLNKIASQEEKKILGRWNIDYCNKKVTPTGKKNETKYSYDLYIL